MYAKESVGLYRQIGDVGGEAAALTTLAGAALVEGDGARARELYEQALESTRTLDDPFRLASALGNLGYLLLMEGENARAAKLFEEGLIVFRRLSSEEGVARSLLNLGFASWQRSAFGEAAALMRESLRRFATIGSREGIAYCLEGLAAAAVAQEEHLHAARLLGASDAVCQSLGLTLDPFELALHRWSLAEGRRVVGEEAFEREFAAGKALSVDAAAELALGEAAAGEPVLVDA
jgi:tetratricopeptide (TPR) repeat protein